MTIRTIHLGVGGRGAWPIRLIGQRQDYETVALVDIRAENLAAARATTGLGQDVCFDTLDTALEAVEAEAVIVITPPDLHAAQCLEAVRAGKHVLVEKPFTKDLAQALQIVEEAGARNLKVMVCQDRRYAPLNATLHRLIRDQVYGAPSFGLMTRYGWRPGTHHSGVDHHAYLWERGIHDLDEIRFVLKAHPKRVWGHSFNPSWSPYKGGGGLYAWVEFDQGATFGFMCTFAAHSGGSTLRLECEGGTLQVVGGELQLQRPGADEPESLPLDQSDPQAALLDGFYRYIRQDVEPGVSGSQNLVTVGLVECIGAASDQGAVLDFDEYMKKSKRITTSFLKPCKPP
jgi:predicted dehydrogenase